MNNYEIIHYEQGLSARILLHSVNRFRLHWHKELELLLVLKGEIETNINGQKYTLAEDDLFLINPGELHGTAGNGDNIVAAIQINSDFCKKTCPELQSTRFDFTGCILKERDGPLAQQLRTLVAQMIYEYSKASAGYQLAIEGLLNLLLATLVRSIPQTEPAHTVKVSKEMGRIQRILHYMDAHYTEKLSLEELANNVFLSPSYLSHFFKDKVGLTFQEYLSRVRLHEAVHQLECTDDLIGDIAMNCGFASAKAFNKAFRSFYGVTPGEYRTAQSPRALVGMASEGTMYMEFDSLQAMDRLSHYLVQPAPLASSPLAWQMQRVEQCIALHAPARETWKGSWNRMGAVGRAWDLLRSDLQQHTRQAKEELGYKLLRFHGIFSDEMRVVRRAANGTLQFCWQYTDIVLDFLTHTGLAPVMDLTFMPTALASGADALFFYKGNITPPQKIEEWQQLVEAFVRHCVGRYGATQVRTWYFEVWNEPDYLGWPGGAAQYFAFFKATAASIRAVDAQLTVAGPSIMHAIENQEHWLPGFLEQINESGCVLDCFTFHVYGENGAVFTPQAALLPLLGGDKHVREHLEKYRRQLACLKRPVKEVLVTEYNISAVHKNYLLDTMFPACALLHHALQTDALTDGVAVWTLSDVFEEDAELLPAFSGGFGMMTVQGIRKPTWHALRFLRMLGSEVVYKSDACIVTRQSGAYQILAFCYTHYDYMYSSGDRSLLGYHQRYSVFEDRHPLQLVLQLEGLQGSWRAERYALNREHGSAWELYEAMGAPPCLTPEQAAWLERAAQPNLTVERLQLDGSFTLTLEIPVHGIQFVHLLPDG